MKTLRERLVARFGALKSERSGWDSACREVTDYLLPYIGRYTPTDINRGERRNTKIIDSSATRFARGLSAALMSYNNSPARPWFALRPADVGLSSNRKAKSWLRDASERMHAVIASGNTYRTFHQMYDEAIAFGTAVSIVRPDFENVLWHYPVTNGRFLLADNARGEIDLCHREVMMTAAQMAQEFGAENCSESVQRALTEPSNWDTRFQVIHAIELRDPGKRDVMKRDGKNKKFMSVYLELAGREDKILREDGFDRFPVLAPRWNTTGGDVYGNGPAFECIGHIKQLQLMAEQEAKAIEYGVEPPLQVPSSLKEKDVNRLPGGTTPVDGSNPASKIQEMWRVSLDVAQLQVSKLDVREQIRQSFFADVFQAFTGMDSTQRTAEEIKARGNEIMTILGPVTASVQREMHEPFIEMLFEEMLKGGAFPPIPDELNGAMIGIEYVSPLAQAQKAIATVNMDRFQFMLGNLVAVKPDILDKVDLDKHVEVYADALGIHPDEIVPGDQVALIRQKRDAANAAKEQAAMMNQQADTGKMLSETELAGSRSALDQLTGYSQ